MADEKWQRPTLDEYLMRLAIVASTRGTCDRRRVGCVIASAQGHVLSTGYNGSAPGADHCDDVGHLLHNNRCVRTIHAEANAISHAARRGTPLDRGIAYCTTRPCPACSLLLAAAGISTVYYLEVYHAAEDDVSSKLGVNIRFEQFGDPSWKTG